MGHVVFKFPLSFDPKTDTASLALPAGAQVLSAGIQGNDFMLWALVDPMLRAEARTFMIKGTGHNIYAQAKDLKFIDTVHTPGPFGPSFVFHIFELL